jgi:hypothetical protein
MAFPSLSMIALPDGAGRDSKGQAELLLPQGCLRITPKLDQDAACILCTVAPELAIIPEGNAGVLSGGLSIDRANRGYMLSLSLRLHGRRYGRSEPTDRFFGHYGLLGRVR